MSAGPFRTAWLILGSCLLILRTALTAFYYAARGKGTRSAFDQLIQTWSCDMISLMQINLTVHPRNFEFQDNQTYIIMCNHTSHLDIPIAYSAWPDITMRMLAKRELGRIPIFGHGLRLAEFPFVDRKNREQAIRDLQTVKKLMQSGIVIWIAPEGTRVSPGQTKPLKKGGFITAIEANAHIIPMYITGAEKVLPARSSKFTLNQDVSVKIGMPIDASHYSIDERDGLMETFEKAWEALKST